MPAVTYRTVDIDGVDVFVREAGPVNAPAVLLPHGYPSSSFQFRHLIPALADRWRVVAPDFPGFGRSATPDPGAFDYSFAGYDRFLERFAGAMGLGRFAMYLHDYGGQAGLRLATRRPDLVAALVIQNTDAYEDELGPKYDALRAYWANPTDELRAEMAEEVSEAGFRREFLGEIPEEQRALIAPDQWALHWACQQEPARRELMVRLFADIEDNVRLYPDIQRALRDHQFPALIVWGPEDGYMPAASGRAYLRDLPRAELHMTDGGHWLLETHADVIAGLCREFLGRVHTGVTG
jgi:pimeloyl-ACP methyl ester carboxylesterase